MSSGSPEARERPLAWWWLAVLLAAVLPSAGTLGAPLISDDGAILGYVHDEGALGDWTGSQYDLHTVRFWRPMVTTGFAAQEATTGVASLPLRLFNLAGHAASAWLLGLLALALGAGRIGALVAGLLCAWFPDQGGNVTWIAGRVDSQCVPFVLAACVLALRDRRAPALVAGFLALAAKELAVVLSVWVALLAWGRGERPTLALRRALPLALLTLAVGIWRRLALGTWVGGYPATGASEDPAGLALGFARSLGGAFAPLLVALVLVLLLARPACGLRRTTALIGCSVAAALPLVHLFASGSIAPEHARTLWLADSALALAVGAAFPAVRAGGRRGLAAAALVVAMVLAAWRGEEARRDVLDWAEGAARAEAEVQAVRDEIAEDPPSRGPALGTRFSRLTEHGAYVLHWGVADRFRAPFPESPRPVWPWRPVLEAGGEAARREPAFAPAGGVLRPTDDEGRRFPELEVRVDGPLAVTGDFVLAAGERDRSPRLAAGLPPGSGVAAWEVVFACELGYRAAAVGGASDAIELRLRDVLLAVGDVFLLAIDFRAERAFLELRALGPGGRDDVLASSRWLEVVWDREELAPVLLAD